MPSTFSRVPGRAARAHRARLGLRDPVAIAREPRHRPQAPHLPRGHVSHYWVVWSPPARSSPVYRWHEAGYLVATTASPGQIEPFEPLRCHRARHQRHLRAASHWSGDRGRETCRQRKRPVAALVTRREMVSRWGVMYRFPLRCQKSRRRRSSRAKVPQHRWRISRRMSIARNTRPILVPGVPRSGGEESHSCPRVRQTWTMLYRNCGWTRRFGLHSAGILEMRKGPSPIDIPSTSTGSMMTGSNSLSGSGCSEAGWPRSSSPTKDILSRMPTCPGPSWIAFMSRDCSMMKRATAFAEHAARATEQSHDHR